MKILIVIVILLFLGGSLFFFLRGRSTSTTTPGGTPTTPTTGHPWSWTAFGKVLWRIGIWLLLASILVPIGTCNLTTCMEVREGVKRAKQGPQMPRGQVMVERIASLDDWSEPVMIGKAISACQRTVPEAHVVIEASSQYGDIPTGTYSVKEYDWPPLADGPHMGNHVIHLRFKTKRTAQFPLAEKTNVLVYIKQ